MNFISDDIARATYLVLILLSISGWLFSSMRADLSKTVQRALIWLLIFVGLVGAYGLWQDIKTEMMFSESFSEVGDNIFEIKKAADGHFYTVARINDVEIRLLIDTGASATVISSADMKKIGISTADLDFSNPIQTAGGSSVTAKFFIDKFEWFGIELPIRRLQTAKIPLFTSLLGMDVIGECKSFTISGNKLRINF